MPSSVIKLISKRLVSISETQQSCFQRKIRPLSEFGYFKGTEFLYGGPFVLKNALPLLMYENFKLLRVAITLLCNPKTYLTYAEVAQSILERFFNQFSEIYGNKIYLQYAFVNDQSFVAPEWPLNVASDYEAFEKNLHNKSYRDQIVIAFNILIFSYSD